MKYALTRSRRFSVSLQIGKRGELLVRAPYLYPTYLIDRFVESKKSWIAKHRNNLKKPVPRLKRFISNNKLVELITELVKIYSKQLSLSPSSLRFTNVRTYWGSCSPKGVLAFNLKLAYTNKIAVEYVVVHELSHLKYRGHGKMFWNLVSKTYPHTKEARKFLRSIPRSL